jgi:hypothetical protein
MITNLFTRKPIFVLTLIHTPSQEEMMAIKSSLVKELGNEYKVVIITDPTKTFVDTKILK